MPDVSAEADSTVFVIPIVGRGVIPAGSRLIVRCDNRGDAWVRIVKAGSGSGSGTP